MYIKVPLLKVRRRIAFPLFNFIAGVVSIGFQFTDDKDYVMYLAIVNII